MGQFELSGWAPMPKGEAQIEVRNKCPCLRKLGLRVNPAFTETKKQSPNTGARANNTLRK